LEYDWRMIASLPREADRLLGEYLHKIEQCLALLSPSQLWWRANPKCNSVANLLLHLCGNLSQWVLDGLGGQTYERHRREEFAAREGEPGTALAARLHDVVAGCREVVQGLSAADLGKEHTIQGIDRSGLGVLLHAVEHMAYHTGQIVHITKELVGAGAEIEFYPHLK
jgi:uncharacterized damage-inducible protein DinB